jgi:serine/threonine protein phosphatase PrpC
MATHDGGPPRPPAHRNIQSTPIPAGRRDAEPAAPPPLPRERRATAAPFVPGQPIGQHLRIERQIRVAPERTWYLVHNGSPRWYTQKCWSCGNKHSPATAQSCAYCHAPLGLRRFLLSARFDASDAYTALVERRLSYPTIATPLALYQYGEQLLSVYPWEGEALLIGEPSPLPVPTLLSVAFQLADALSFLHAHGVVLQRLTAGNVLIAPDGTARLFDLEVDAIRDRPLRATDDPTQPPMRDLRELALILSEWCAPEEADFRRFLKRTQRGAWHTADALAAAISAYSHQRRPSQRPPRVAAFSDVGLIRRLNEDDWAWRRLSDALEVYAVADGMGGHEAGDVASQLATRTLVRTLERRLGGPDEPAERAPPPPAELERAMAEAFQAANQAVWTIGGGRAEQMGSTLVALLVVRPHGAKRYAILGNLGDSRLYRLRDGALTQVSEDQSMVAAMVAAGKITPDEARVHPKANVLLNFVGMSAQAEADLTVVDLQDGDRLLLCTDGVWGEVPDALIAGALLQESDPRRVVHRLLRLGNDAGGKDNLTAVLIDD